MKQDELWKCGIIATCLFFVLLSFYVTGQIVSYRLILNDMVIETIKENVKKESLRE